MNAPILHDVRHGDSHRFWQAGGGYDRNVFTNNELPEKVNYVHNNPVRRGLSKRRPDYVWSSASWDDKKADS